jgi:hypothetical protein
VASTQPEKGMLRQLVRACLASQRYAYCTLRLVFEEPFEVASNCTEQHRFMRHYLLFRVDPTQAIVVE